MKEKESYVGTERKRTEKGGKGYNYNCVKCKQKEGKRKKQRNR